ncbi:Uncharacterised protein [Salmonella enterica subsp. enterica serovar Bovismorbificans]|uniref:Uncharacterized protein n=1 Tax=Salmonella enterica subsp. enterica serovar Bovismorbificans TaxID=58097 RepID=A0A655CC59_SALET|nr:Uncharacterised protein [Salmonella enterica subsp. enterica serovar Bovismorbificans]CNU17662.1 Uncharacterised protein [Salmonella enterica subsp. enterica serovar Bovismorbificans]
MTLTTQTGRPDDTTRGQIVQTVIFIRDKRVARIFALANGHQTETVREGHRNVFHRVHGDISAFFQQRDFKLFNKQSLTAHFRQGSIENHVAACDHRHQFYRQSRMGCHQCVFDIMCLPKRKGTLACGNS